MVKKVMLINIEFFKVIFKEKLNKYALEKKVMVINIQLSKVIFKRKLNIYAW